MLSRNQLQILHEWKAIKDIVHQVFVRDVYPLWLNRRQDLIFADWEKICISFNTKDYLQRYEKIILKVFDKFENLNYEMFWRLQSGDL